MTLFEELLTMQNDYNRMFGLYLDTLIGDTMTPNVKDYTTEELERLTTLTPVTARVGEYVLGAGVVQLRTKDRVVCSDGSSDTPRAYTWVERRVHSFANHTELDPPQAEMLAELKRRKEPPISNATHAGRRVRVDGHEALVVSRGAARAWREYCNLRHNDRSAVICWLYNGYLSETCDYDTVELLHD